ncbi:MAG: hypothetical protein ACFFCZ_31055 [Promethearchaeota archaeon]
MKVELYYFDGCPNYNSAISNLKSALQERDISSKIEIIRVKSPEHAQELNFQGSPSIVIDGIDLERKDDPALFGCRIYEIDGKLTGNPTRQFIGDKLDELIKSNST